MKTFSDYQGKEKDGHCLSQGEHSTKVRRGYTRDKKEERGI